MQRRASGDWSPDKNLQRFPEAKSKSTAPAPTPAPSLSFDNLLKGWARDHGFDLDARPIARAAYDRERTLERLASFLGHRDAIKVAKPDAVRWKEEMQARGLAAEWKLDVLTNTQLPFSLCTTL
jgi:hypothetical protein